MSRIWIVLWGGVVAYLVAWFLPVHMHGTTLIRGGLPGWEAFRGALDGDLTSKLSALSNLLLLWAGYRLLRARSPVHRALSFALFAAAILNTQWFVLNAQRGDLRIGYYLWEASFWLFALAALGRSGPREARASLA